MPLLDRSLWASTSSRRRKPLNEGWTGRSYCGYCQRHISSGMAWRRTKLGVLHEECVDAMTRKMNGGG